MTPYEAIGLGWTIFCTTAGSVGVLLFAYVGLRRICEDAKAGMEHRRSIDRLFRQEKERV
jgi:hypothetical protein